jgi:flagellar assembly protein FliH
MAAEREVQARALGRQQGELECRAKFEEQLGRERSAVAAALADFARERGTYYQRLEQEAVQLSLSIARKILHREAQVDPLLLMGVVRVALEKIEGASGVVLAVAPQQAPGWQRYLSTHLDPGTMPEIVEEAAMPPERCTLKTSMGTAELGLEVQLKEIEQGLMDLLAARPGEKA